MFFKSKVNREVRLDKNKDYVFCFNKGTIILEEQCNMYEHNKNCDANDDFWGRTHRKGSSSGVRVGKHVLLNECKYCLRKRENVRTYCLSEEAMKCYTSNAKRQGDKMTVKQFTTKGIIYSSYCVWDSDDKPYGNDEVVELLNELSKENEELKQQIGNLEHTKDFCAECCERLEKENEELKSEIRKVQREYEQLWMHTYK